jgi:hypothetical protein
MGIPSQFFGRQRGMAEHQANHLYPVPGSRFYQIRRKAPAFMPGDISRPAEGGKLRLPCRIFIVYESAGELEVADPRVGP